MIRTMKNIEIIGITKEIWYTVAEKMRERWFGVFTGVGRMGPTDINVTEELRK